jgi:hypothetical protein
MDDRENSLPRSGSCVSSGIGLEKRVNTKKADLKVETLFACQWVSMRKMAAAGTRIDNRT